MIEINGNLLTVRPGDGHSWNHPKFFVPVQTLKSVIKIDNFSLEVVQKSGAESVWIPFTNNIGYKVFFHFTKEQIEEQVKIYRVLANMNYSPVAFRFCEFNFTGRWTDGEGEYYPGPSEELNGLEMECFNMKYEKFQEYFKKEFSLKEFDYDLQDWGWDAPSVWQIVRWAEKKYGVPQDLLDKFILKAKKTST